MAKQDESPIVELMWKPRNGGLNSDVSYEDMSAGDMGDGLNARSIGEGEHVSPGYETGPRNEYITQVDPVVAQNKKTLFTIDAGTTVVTWASSFITIFDQNNNIVTGTQSWNLEGTDFATTIVNLIAALDTILGSGNYTLDVTTITPATGTAELEIQNDTTGAPIPYNEFTVVPLVQAGADFTVTMSVTQEAIDAGLAGEQQCIGNRYLTESWQLWTSQKKEIILLNVISAADNGSGVIRIGVDDTTIITDLSTVVIFGIIGTTEANGRWIATIIDATHIDLLGSVFTNAYVSGGKVTVNPYGIGEIGVVTKNYNTLLYTYVRLLRTKEWNFRTEHQADVLAQQDASKYSIYWNDFNNVDRCFYYKPPFITDGALSVNGGQYDYGTIGEETALIQNTFRARITLSSVSNSGGQVLSGNHLFFCRGKSASLTTTVFSEPSGLVNIYLADPGAPETVIGDDVAVASTKAVNLNVTGITPSAFKELEIIDVNFIGLSAVTAQVVKSVILAPGQTTAIVTVTGFETEAFDIDPGIINTLFTPFPISRNLSQMVNRLFRSNLKGYSQIDLSAWFATFKHSLFKKTIPTVGCINSFPTNGSYHLHAEEYMSPPNVNVNIGYMPFECYRFLGKARFKQEFGGGTGDDHWVDDIIFNTNAYNIDPAYPDNRRVAGLIDWNLTDNYAVDITGDLAPNPYVFYVSFHDMDLNYPILVNGVMRPIRDIIETFYIEVVPCIPEVLGSGLGVLAVSGTGFAGPQGGNLFNMYYNNAYDTVGTFFGEFPFITGHTFDSFNGIGLDFIPDNPQYDTVTGWNLQRNYGSFYIPDVIWSQTQLDFQANDKIINLGAAQRNSVSGFVLSNTNGTKEYNSHYNEYGGFVGFPGTPSDHIVDEMHTLNYGQTVALAGFDYSKRLILKSNRPAATPALFEVWANPKSPVFHVTTPIDNSAATNTDWGAYVMFYYRGKSVYNALYNPDTSKYGLRTNSLGIPTGAFYDITPSSPNIVPVSTVNVFGGDTMVQKTYMLHRSVVESQWVSTAEMGFGGGTSFYSANRMNAQMRRKENATDGPMFPEKSLGAYLETPHSGDPLFYNQGYTPANPVNVHNSFNPNVEQVTAYPSRIDFSQNKPNDSLVDNYRDILPFDFYDLNLSDGAIMDMFVWNYELVCRQRNNVNRLYVDSTTQVTAAEGESVILGTSGILRRRPTSITTIGSENKWMRIMGVSQTGKDVAYWVNPKLKQWVRYGYDGANPISDIHQMQSFLANWLTWVVEKDTPVHSQGGHGVWNHRYREAIMTFRGHKNVPDWVVDTPYEINAEVASSTVIPLVYTFLQQYQIYIALQAVPSGIELIDTDYWFPVPHFGDPVVVNDALTVDPKDFYSEFTMVFNEINNRFRPRHSCVPNIYMPFSDTYFSPRPIDPTGTIFAHDAGNDNWCQWYLLAGISQQENGFIEPVFNDPPGEYCRYMKQRIDSFRVPYFVEDRTRDNLTNANSTDFTGRNNIFDAPIKNDIQATGLNNGDTSRIYGRYLRKRIFFQPLFYQRIQSATQVVKIMPRRSNT